MTPMERAVEALELMLGRLFPGMKGRAVAAEVAGKAVTALLSDEAEMVEAVAATLGCDKDCVNPANGVHRLSTCGYHIGAEAVAALRSHLLGEGTPGHAFVWDYEAVTCARCAKPEGDSIHLLERS